MTLAVSARRRSLSARRIATRDGSTRVVIVLRRQLEIGDEREHDPEHRAAASHAPKIDAATMVLHDLVGNRQAQAGARVFRGEERVEYAIGDRRRNSPSTVLHLDAQPAVERAPDAAWRIPA